VSDSQQPGSRAPYIVFGTILLIGLSCLGVVIVSDCNRDQPYQDAEYVRPGTPPPPSLPPPPGRPRPAADAGTPPGR
jgi:hypothetical protein